MKFLPEKKMRNMIEYGNYIDNRGVLGIVRRACNYVDARLVDHGFRVACIVSRILARLGGYTEKEMRDICILALYHDIGAYKTEEISRMLEFETRNMQEHSIYGYLFIKYFTPLQEVAPGVLFHHTTWSRLQELPGVSPENKRLAQIMYIADRADVCLEEEGCSYQEFARRLLAGRGVRYSPEIADIVLAEDFLELSSEREAWEAELWEKIWKVPFTKEEIRKYLDMVIYTIDFRSRHTVTHTMTTTSISYELAKRMELKGRALSDIYFGSLLHDLGKIGIPVEILEFPGKLSPQAMRIMRAHVELTGLILGPDVEEKIRKIAMRHHEKLDGSGYPLGLTAMDLSLEERIVAVADIVSALAGTRSYKEAFSRERIVGIIGKMKEDGLIDGSIVDVMTDNFDDIMGKTGVRCQPIMDMYQDIQREYQELAGYMEGDWNGRHHKRATAANDA